jgi:hypothetical protein
VECSLATLCHFAKDSRKLVRGIDRVIDLEREKVYIVNAFAQWLETGTIDEHSLSAEALSRSPLFHEELWVFAEKLKCDDLCNLVVDFLVYKYRHGKITPTSAKYAYENTTGPELKGMVRDVLTFWSPFKKEYQHEMCLMAIKDWENFFAGGGEIVVDVAKRVVHKRELEEESGPGWEKVFSIRDYYIGCNPDGDK